MNIQDVKILQLNVAGQPQRWLTPEKAAEKIVKGQVAWSTSNDILKLTGGIQRATGILSTLAIDSIIAVRGEINKYNTCGGKIVLTNRSLFARDKNMCAYCGETIKKISLLSRDHVIPTSKGGEDCWTNVVTCCIPCNQKKDNKTLSNTSLKLLYVPYKPCHSESLLLANRNILADQHEFLLQTIKKAERYN